MVTCTFSPSEMDAIPSKVKGPSQEDVSYAKLLSYALHLCLLFQTFRARIQCEVRARLSCHDQGTHRVSFLVMGKSCPPVLTSLSKFRGFAKLKKKSVG